MYKINAYLAGGIFTLGDELRNKYFAEKLREAFPNMDLYSPIENTAINGVEGKKKFAGSRLIEEADNERLDNTDILIACIDGDVLPSGTCAEIGIMREKIRRGDHKYIIGICTDNRECSRTHSLEKDEGGANAICESQYSYQNLYVVGCIKSSGVLVNNIDDVIKFIDIVKDEFDPTTMNIEYCYNCPGCSACHDMLKSGKELSCIRSCFIKEEIDNRAATEYVGEVYNDK